MLTDIRLALRRLRRTPGFTTVAVLTVGLAIGANTAILGVADAVLFRPLGYGDAERLRVVRMLDPRTGQRYFRIPPEYLDAIENDVPGIGPVAYVERGSRIAQTRDGATRIPTAAVSPDYFSVIRVAPHRGRLFDERDVGGGGRPAILSYSAWQERFGGDENAIGQPLELGGETWDITGVLPPGFRFPSTFAGDPEIVTVLEPRAPGDGAFLPVVRLDPGVSPERVQAALDAMVAGIYVADPGIGNTVPVLDGVREVLFSTGRPIMVFLLVAAGLVLLIACANLANLFMAAARRRERETGVAAALGAGRLRLVRPVVIETTVIALAGAIIALVISAFAFDFLLGLVPRDAYGEASVGVDGRVGVFAVGMGMAAGLLSAIMPALHIARLDPYDVIMNATRSGARRLRFGRPMIALQVALAVVVVFGAAIATRAFVRMLRVPLGVSPDGVALLEVSPQLDGGAEREAFYGSVVRTLEADPDVIAAGATGSLPVTDGVPWSPASAMSGGPETASVVHVMPGYFETAGIPLVSGRTLDWSDAGGTAALVSESAARSLFPGEDPIGTRFVDTSGRSFTVVGVAADVLMRLDYAPPPPAYVLPGNDTRALTVVARLRTRDAAALENVRRTVARLAPGSVVTGSWWSADIAALTPYRNPRFQSVVLSGFAVLALGVTALGIIGVIAFTMTLRRREMGIRLALGVAPRGLVGLMMRYALAPVVAGLAAGLIATRALTTLAEAQLFEVDATDPLTLAVTALTVLLATAAAAWLPARRAANLDPIRTLKAD